MIKSCEKAQVRGFRIRKNRREDLQRLDLKLAEVRQGIVALRQLHQIEVPPRTPPFSHFCQ